MAVPNVFSPNTQIKSSQVNANFDYITDRLVHNCGFAVYRSSSQSGINGTSGFTVIQFDGTEYDPNGVFDSSANYVFTAPVGGLYTFSAMARFGNIETDKVYSMYIFADPGAEYVIAAARTGIDDNAHSFQRLSCSAVVHLEAGDEVYVAVESDDTSFDLAGESSTRNTRFSGALLSYDA